MATYSFNFPKTRIVGGLDAVRSALTENNMALETWLNTRITATADLVLATIGDMVLDAPVDGELLRFNGTNWVNNTLAEAGVSAVGHTHLEADITDLQSYLLNITGESIGDLSDVTVTAVTTDEILGWNGSAWVNRTLAEASISGALHTHTLDDDLSDVVIISPASGHILEYTGAVWTNNTLAGAGISETTHNHTVSGLSDTTITSIATDEMLQWNGSAWINQTIAELGLARIPTQVYARRGTSAQTNIASGTAFAWNTEEVDDWGGWASSPNPERITVDEAGFYQVDLFYGLDALVALKSYRVRVMVNGTTDYGDAFWAQPNVSTDHTGSMSFIIELAANDYLTAYITHNESPDTVDLNPGHKSGMRVTKLF